MSKLPKVTEVNMPESLRTKACPHMLPALVHLINTGEDPDESVAEHANTCKHCTEVIEWGVGILTKGLGEPHNEPGIGMAIPLDEKMREKLGCTSYCLRSIVHAANGLLLFFSVGLVLAAWAPASAVLIGLTVVVIGAYTIITHYTAEAQIKLKSMVSYGRCMALKPPINIQTKLAGQDNSASRN